MKVKICIGVDKYGGWRCSGWADRMTDGSMNYPTNSMLERSVDKMGYGSEKKYFIIAEIPDPPAWFIEGKVEEKEGKE